LGAEAVKRRQLANWDDPEDCPTAVRPAEIGRAIQVPVGALDQARSGVCPVPSKL
jgi:hypothetical protein